MFVVVGIIIIIMVAIVDVVVVVMETCNMHNHKKLINSGKKRLAGFFPC